MVRKPFRSGSKSKRKRGHQRTAKLNVESLDPRVMLDASGAVTEAIEFSSAEDSSAPAKKVASVSDNAADTLSSTASSLRREIVFVDAGVEGQDELLNSLQSSRPGVLREIVEINSDSDGLVQIATNLDGRQDIAAIHILSHGNSGELRLGDAVVSQSQLATDYASTLETIGAALANDGDILLYGCDLASDDGLAFVNTFAELTSADIAASDDTTGHASLDGDWDLEVITGTVQARTLQATAWLGTLDTAFYLTADGTDQITIADPTDSNPATNEEILGSVVNAADIEAIARDPFTGEMYAINQNELGSIDQDTGVYTAIGTLGTASSSSSGASEVLNPVVSLGFDPTNGDLYAVYQRAGNDWLFKINKNTGSVIPGAFGAGEDFVPLDTVGAGGGESVDAIAIDDVGDIFISTSRHLLSVDVTGGSADVTLLGAHGTTVTDMEGLAVDSNGNLWGSTGDTSGDMNRIWEISKTSGAATNPIVLDDATDYESLEAFCAEVDLELSKTASTATANVGDTVTFTVTVTNPDLNILAPGVEVTDATPAGMTLVSAVPSKGTFDAATGTWDIGVVAAASSETLQLSYLVESGAPASITNTAEITEAHSTDIDSTPGNGNAAEDDQDAATITIGQIDTDGDGVPDVDDIDDDNDGILDEVEGCSDVASDALVQTYTQAAVCSAGQAGDPVLVVTNAPNQNYQTATYGTSMTSDPNATPPAGVVGEFSHPDWTIDQIGTVFYTEYGSDGSIYIPASRFVKNTFRGVGLQQTGAIGDAYAASLGNPAISGQDVIYKTDPITGAPSVWAAIDTSDGSIDRGFGGITYDETTNTFYVVNMGTGAIHHLDATGNVLNTYTPSLPTVTYTDPGSGATNSFQNKPFGIDINPVDGRLYYTVIDGNLNLNVRSVGLDAIGDMTGTDIQEYNQPFSIPFPNDGSPFAADIDFNDDGRMAIGSLTSNDYSGGNNYFDSGDEATVNNHSAYNYILDGSSGSWSQTAITSVGQEEYAGGSAPNSTATGGVAWNLDPALNQDILWMSGGDFFGEDSNWGVIGYDTTQFQNTPSQEDATNYIQFLFADSPAFGTDPKGNGADVDVFYSHDVDWDLIANCHDLDSDNDGISDLHESGAPAAAIAADTNKDGMVSIAEAEAVLGVGNADANGDGLIDLFAPGGTIPVDTDSDGLPDFTDLDADADGIPDTVEGRPTAGYVPNADPAGDNDTSNDDADGDGIIDIFDANDGTTGEFGGTSMSLSMPPDYDEDGIPDYRDTDTDGDGASDTVESGLTLSGVDANNDGIDDAIGADPHNPDGDINDPSTDLGNELGDTTEVGYRETDYDLALTKIYASDTFGATTDGTIAVGADVTFTIEVTNQGGIAANSFAVTDYIPAGFQLNDANWTFNNDATATSGGTATFTYTGPTLASGASTQIPITLTAVSPSAGQNINIAEISADDGVELDSIPDSNVANDNQPAAPGDATDNETGNANGDEDDHDLAGVNVVAYDLALTKVYTSDTFGNTSDGVIEAGSDVTFTIEVFNQGTQTANTFELTDYLPLGFTLNDSAWTFNNDATATSGGTATLTYSGPALAPNTSTTVPITLTAVDPTPGSLINIAEISNDDGTDIDSTADATVGNDNQPVNQGDATDNETDNANGDEDDHDIAAVTVQDYDLALTKVYTSDSTDNSTDGIVDVGDNVTFTIEITNQGTVPASAFQITDYIPNGFALNDANWTFNNDATATSGGTATFTYSGAPLAGGASTPITIQLTAVSAPAGTFTNTAEISMDDGSDGDSTTDSTVGNDTLVDDVIDGTGGDEDDHDVAEVTVAPQYDLALTKVYTSDTHNASSDGIIAAGADVTFTIQVFNQGDVAANSFQITDYLPLGFALNDGAWTFNNDATATSGGTATFTYAGAAVAPNTSAQIPITLTAVAPTDGNSINIAEISNDDGDDIDSTTDAMVGNDNQPANQGDATDNEVDNAGGDEDDHDLAAVTVESYDLALTKVYTSDTSADGMANDGTIMAGDDVTFTIEITNQGTATTSGFTVTDYIPLGFTLNDPAWSFNSDATATSGGTASFTYTGAPLTAGGTTQVTITLNATTPTDAVYPNYAEISADDGADIDSTTDTTVDNDSLTDDIIDGTNGDEDDHDIAEVTVVAPDFYDLALIKTVASDTSADGIDDDGILGPGDEVTFDIDVINQGTVAAGVFVITEHLPLGFVLNDPAWVFNNDATATSGGTATYTHSGAPILPDTVFTIPINLDAVDPNGAVYVNFAEISADDGADVDSTPDEDPNNDVVDDNRINNANGDEDDSDIATITVVAPTSYDLALTKVYTSDTLGNTTDGFIEAGADVTFTIEVTNQGTDEAAAFEVTDYLPLGFALNDPNWTFNNDATATSGGTATHTYSGAALAATTGSVQIPITLTAVNPIAGDFINIAEISADDGNDVDSTTDSTVGNDNQPAAPGDATDNVTDNTAGDEDDHDIAGVTVGAYDLALTKVYTSDTAGNTTDGVIEIGSDVTFTIEVTNQGTVDVATFEVTDYLPLGFTLNDANWTFNNDATGSSGGTATFTYAGATLAPTDSTQIPITLTAVDPVTGDDQVPDTFINIAEISADGGTDVDSTTDSTAGNDNQPAAPGDATDNEIDNTAGDEDDHDIAGVVVEEYDLALTKVYTSDTHGNTTDGVIEAGADVTFTIEVTNQGSATANAFDITDYIPPGFTLNDANWTFNNDATATSGGTATHTYAGGGLVPGDATQVTITLTAVSPVDGLNVNLAEISSDDGDDVDSTADTSVGNDNQPAAPGDATDNLTNNVGGDEDDHDIAGVIAQAYDLALTKVYASDTGGGIGNNSDGIVVPGDDVTFVITITNQGSITANTFEVTDYIPNGFALNDTGWTFNNDATATSGGTATFTYSGSPLGPNDTVQIPIVLTAVDPTDATYINFAEISADDGNDGDSTPDATNDDPFTDDVTDNSNGDEDDHDPAEVEVESTNIYDLALSKVYTSDTSGNTTDGVIAAGADVTFTIEITNQGNVDADAFEITDYIPLGFTLNDANWTFNNDATATSGGTATFTYSGSPLAPMGSVPVTITLTAVTPTSGNLVNIAEISSDDGNDTDSTTDADVANDNQPAAPGDATDNEIDNGAGDEDDHDIAGVSLGNADLVTVKTLTSGDSTPDEGDTVTFQIVVTNNGPESATNVSLTDLLPAGLTATANNGTASLGGSYDPITGLWSIGTLADGAVATLTLEGTVDAGQGGNSIINVTTAAMGDQDDPSTVGDDLEEPVAVNTPADVTDLVTVKTLISGDSTPDEGDIVGFQIVVTNNGPGQATNVSLNDLLPAGLTPTANNGTGSLGVSYDPVTGLWTIGTLNSGAMATLVLEGTVNAGQAGNTITNVTTAAAGDQDDPSTVGDDLEEPVVVNDPAVVAANLVTVKTLISGDSTPDEGDIVTFQIVVTNNGPDQATNVSLNDLLPAGLTPTANNGSGALGVSYDPVTGLWTIGTLNSGAMATLVLEGTVNAGQAGNTITNVTTAAAGDQNDPDTIGDDLEEPVVVNDPSVGTANLVTVKTLTSGDSTPDEGDIVTFQIVVTNNGPDQATNVSLNDLLPAGLTPTANNGTGALGVSYDPVTGLWTVGTLNNGAMATLILEGTVNADQAGSTITNVTTAAAGDQNDPDTIGDDLVEPVSVNDNNGGANEYDLALTKVYTSDTTGNASDGVIQVGADVTFTIQVTNQGTLTANTFDVTDYLPVGFVLNDSAWTFNNDASVSSGGTATITYSGSPLAPGQSTTLTITLRAISASTGSHTNFAEISADDGDDVDSTTDAIVGNDNVSDNVTNNQNGDEDDHDPAEVNVVSNAGGLNLYVVKDDGVSLTSAGGSLVYAVQYGNNGTVNATGVTLTETLPTGTSHDAANSTSGWTETSAGSGIFTLAVGPLAAGQMDSAQFAVTVDDPLAGGITTITNQVSIADDGNNGAETDLTDNADDDVDNIEVVGGGNAPDLAIQKTDGGVTTTLNGIVVYTITFTNNGPTAASGVLVHDLVPAGTVFNAANSTAGWTPIAGGEMEFNVGNMAVGEVQNLTFAVQITDPSLVGSSILNRVEIEQSGVETNLGNNIDTEVTPVVGGGGGADVYDLALTKVYTSDTFGATNDGVIESGHSVTFTIEVTNQGTVSANSFSITDYIPLGFVVNDANWTFNGDATATSGGTATYSHTGPALAAGASTQVTITLLASNPMTASYTNFAEISADDGDDVDSTADANVGNDSVTDNVINNQNGDEDDHDPAEVTVVSNAAGLNLYVVKDDGVSLTSAGGSLVYTVQYGNNGTVNATGVTLTETLPPGTSHDAANSTSGWTETFAGSGIFTLSVGPLAAGQMSTANFAVTVNNPLPSGLTMIANQVSIADDGANGVESDLTDNADDDIDAVDLGGGGGIVPDLAVSKTDNGVTTSLNGIVVYTITYTNNGPTPATGVLIHDLVPTGTVFNPANSTAGWTPIAGGEMEFNVGNMAAGEVRDVTFAVTVTDPSLVGGSILNRVEIEQSGNETNLGNNIDTEDTPVNGVQQAQGTIAGFVYVDLDNDGVFDGGEMPIPGVVIMLMGTDINGNLINLTTTTLADGSYSFANLVDGDYEVIQKQPVGFLDGIDTVGNLGGTVGQDTFSVVLAGGSFIGDDYNFGENGVDPRVAGKATFLTSYLGGVTALQQAPNAEYASAVEEAEINELIARAEQTALQTTVVTDGSVLRVAGTDAGDQIHIALGLDIHTISVNGVFYRYDASDYHTIDVQSGSGNDRVTVTGTSLDDRADLLATHGKLISEQYTVAVKQSENISFYGGGGYDRAVMADSAGDDVFLGSATFASMREIRNAYRNETRGFEVVTGNAVLGGHDRAIVFGTAGVDHLRMLPEFAQLNRGAGNTEFRASRFEKFEAVGVAGDDTVDVTDSSGDDQLTLGTDRVAIRGDGFDSMARQFKNVNARATRGGNDMVELQQVNAEERVVGAGDRIQLVARNAKIDGFNRVRAVSQADETAEVELQNIDFLFERIGSWSDM